MPAKKTKNQRTVHIRIPLLAELDEYCLNNRIPKSHVFDKSLEEYLRRTKSPPL